jgi:hypothetical protein
MTRGPRPASITPLALAPYGGLAASTSAQRARRCMDRTSRPRSAARSTAVARVGTFPSMCRCCRCGIPPQSSARCADRPSHSDQFPPGWPATRTQAHWIGRLATQSCYQLRLEPPYPQLPRYSALLRIKAKPTVNACSQKRAGYAQDSTKLRRDGRAILRPGTGLQP